MISYDFVPISSQKGILFLRHPVDAICCKIEKSLNDLNIFTEEILSGATPMFLLNYLHQVESLQCFLKTSRQSDLQLYLPVLQEQVKYYLHIYL